MKKRSLAANTVGVMLATTLSKPAGFIRTAVLASVFGATAQTDAFYMVQSIINILAGISSSGLTTTVVPVRAQVLLEEGGSRADKYTSNLINIALIISAIIGVLAAIFTPFLVRIFAPDFSAEQAALTILFVRISTPLLLVSVLVALFSGILNTHHRYIPVQLLGLPFNAANIAFALLLGKTWGIYAMLAGFISGTVLQIFLLIPCLRGIFKYTPYLNRKDAAMRKTFVMAVPAFIGTYANIVNQAVDKALASGLPEGSISAITYANQLTQFVSAIIIMSVITTLFTSLSELAAANDFDRLKSLLSRAAVILVVILAPITLYCVLYDNQIVKIVYERGAFDRTAGVMTAKAFFFYSLSLVFMGVQLSLTRCFYALKDTTTPLIVTIAGVILNVALNFALVGPMQVGGLALATSASYAFMCILLIPLLRRKIGALGILRWIKNVVKILAGLIFMAPAIWIIREKIQITELFNFALAVVVGGAIYIAVLWLLKQEDVRFVADKAYGKLKAQAHKGD